MTAPDDERREFGSLLQLHIPKTAGRTLHALLERHFEPAAVLPVLLDTRAAADGAGGGAAMDRARTRTLRRLGDARRAAPLLTRYRLVVTHDDIDLTRSMLAPVAVVALFRDPVERTHSLFRHVSRNPAHPLHEACADGGLDGFVRAAAGNPRYTDRQCVQVVGAAVAAEHAGDADRLAARAIDHLGRDWFQFGLVERLEQSLAAIGADLGMDLAGGSALRVNAAPDGPRHLTADERRLLEPLNRADQALYDSAVAMFDARPAPGAGRPTRARIAGASVAARPEGVGRRAAAAAAKTRYVMGLMARSPADESEERLSSVARIATGDSATRIDGDSANGPS